MLRASSLAGNFVQLETGITDLAALVGESAASADNALGSAKVGHWSRYAVDSDNAGENSIVDDLN